MTSSRYKIVFDGRIVEGHEVEDVKRNLVLSYRIDPKKVERLFAKRPVVIRKNVDHQTAMKYKRAFERAGAICQILSNRSSQGRRQAFVEDRKEASRSIEEGKVVVCPICGFEQKEPLECGQCGIISSKYRKRVDNSASDLRLSREGSSVPGRSSHHGAPWALIVRLVVVLFMLLGVYKWWTGRAVHHGPGMVAPHMPRQEVIKEGNPFFHDGYRITPLATFWAEARVLRTKTYHFGRESDLAPIDLALGWGPMSDETVLKDIEIGQSSRFYFWRTDRFPIPPEIIQETSANMHLIPANHYIAKRVGRARKGDIVVIKGYLVQVDSPDNWHWRSSLTRSDTGAGACELIWVEEFDIV